MSTEAPEERVEWTLKLGGAGNVVKRRSPQLMLVGARFHQSWLESTTIETSEIYFDGELGQSLNDLRAAARDAAGVAGFSLPIMRLRTSMLARIPGMISIDRDLGIVRPDQFRRPAAVLYAWENAQEGSAGELGSPVASRISECLKRWYHDVLDPWASKHASTGLAQRVLAAAQPSNIRIAPVERPLIARSPAPKRPDSFGLIIRHVAERLVGEELFAGLGPCDLVLDVVGRDPARSNTIELMTSPSRLPGRDESFSMVARLSAITMPYSSDVYLKVSAAKRVWTSQVPGPKRNAPFGVRAYLLAPNQPIFTVSVERTTEQGWQFGQDYAEWMVVPGNQLPHTLAEAVKNPVPDSSGWWAGLPQLTTLFDSVSPRTVFEGDELDLCDAVFTRLGDVVSPTIPFQQVPSIRRRASADVAMLKLSDLGLAGQALDETDDDEPEYDENKLSDSARPLDDKERPNVQRHREQNIEALKAIHGDIRPVLWSFCSNQLERTLIEKTVNQLFGDAVEVCTELLPENTHGLRTNLPGNALKEAARFDLRVDAWKAAAIAVKATHAARHVLICASDRENGRMEDGVNYYAGIHAMCRYGDANVHHVLPISGGDPDKATQNFVHRLQSALLDVFFAHSGKVFGTEEFLRPLFVKERPHYFYGVQAMRSNARAYSGEINVSFLVFTRLHVGTGVTSVRFVYREKRATRETEWMPLSHGLRWLGSQRSLDSDEQWLKTSGAEQIRFWLGGVGKEDPRAVVLVDWSTITSIWRGISDEDLTAGGVPRSDGKDIAAACPQMTLVRLRKGESGIAVRAKNVATFERAPRQGLGGLEASGEVFTEAYGTTTKSIVRITPSIPAAESSRGHYIQSMGYRKTVQILRGQSCYRTMQRMVKLRPDTENPDWDLKNEVQVFELKILDPSKQDAALPAPLEVTVMACPPDVGPDNIAIAVLGMRLGYMHYSDWTALPAPLFFKRKIDDYVIRYRSPATSTDDSVTTEESTASAIFLPTSNGEIADVESPETAPITETAAHSATSDYLRQTAMEVVGPLTDQSIETGALDPVVRETRDEIRSSAEVRRPVPDTELISAADGQLTDDCLLELAKELAQEDFALCGDRASFNRRTRYDQMMRGQIRVHTPVPFFVDSTGIFGDDPPSDREALRRFWRGQNNMRWIGRNDQMPSLAKLGVWVIRRLQIPQGGYSIYRAPLFLPTSLFAPVRDGWKKYVAEKRAQTAPGDPEVEKLSDTIMQLAELTRWAVASNDDKLVAWLVFGSSHFPFAEVLSRVIPNVANPIGVYTREALYYFIACVRAARGVLSIRPDTPTPNLIFKARPRPEERPSGGQSSQDSARIAVSLVAEAKSETASVIENASMGASRETLAEVADQVNAFHTDIGEMTDVMGALRPGLPDFESRLQTIRRTLEVLEREHLKLIAAQTAAREAEELATSVERAREAHIARWEEIRLQATQIVVGMHASLPDTQTWKLSLVADVSPFVLDEVLTDLTRLRSQISAAQAAQDEYQVVVDRATPSSTLTPRESGRHRAQWHAALQTAHETLEAGLNTLLGTFKASQTFQWIDDETVDPPAIPADGSNAPTRPVDTQGLEESKEESVLDLATEADVTTTFGPLPISSNALHALESLAAAAPSEGGGKPAALDLPPTASDSRATSNGPDSRDEHADTSTIEPLAGSQRAEVMLQLLAVRTYAVAEVYVEALQLYQGTESIGDHGLVVSASLETIRRLRVDVAPSQPRNDQLRARIEEGRGPQMPACDPLAASLGVLAAGLGEMVFPHVENGGRWTFIDYLRHRFSDQPRLQAFIERIGTLEGFNITQEMLTAATVGARDAAQNSIARMRERARRWASDEALYRKWTLSDYKNLHDALFKNEELPIARCLGVIARGEDQKLEEACRNARKKFERPLVTAEELGKKMGRKRAFDGVARDYIRGNIERTAQFVEEYREAVERTNGPHTPVAANARSILLALYQDLSGATEVIKALDFHDARDRMYQQLSSAALHELKRIFDCQEPERLIGDAEQMLMLRLPLGTDLRPSLWTRTDNAGNAVPPVVDPADATEEVESLAQLLADAGDESRKDGWIRTQLERAGKDHLSNSRFLPLQSIDKRLGRTDSRAKEQQQCHGALVAQLHNERQRVTHAMALGALTQGEASRMLRLIEELQQVSRSIGDVDTAPAATPDYPHAYAALRRLVTKPLEEKLTDSKRAFDQDLDKYAADNASLPHLQADIERIRELASERSASSIRTARDMFSLLKEGALPRKAPANQRSIATAYREFVDTLKRDAHSHERLVETLAHKLEESPVVSDPEWLSALDTADRADAALFLRSWISLCAGSTPVEIQPSLTTFFRGLRPIAPDVVMQPTTGKSQRTDFILNDSPFAGLDRMATGVFIPPSLGSGASFVQGLVFRNRPSDGAVTQAINERAQAAPTLVLCRGTLTLDKRAAFSRHHPVLLIDDDLVAYAAVHPHERLRRFMQIALLTFHDNPYDDYGRPVPPEMFFGRISELRRLRQVKSAAVLFGGRRLGKSSLLDQLERDAEKVNGEVVLYLTLDRSDHGLSEDHVFLAWDAILRKLWQRGAVARPKSDPTTSSEVRRWIEDEVMAGRCTAKGIYLLIDEADELMGRDLNQRETFVSGLLALTESVRKKCAIRFVIAGLHNLTRMASEENSPFGKFDSIALKPFWSAEDIQRGVELIRVPLEALGFYFAPGKEDMPLRIMAVCNFYPAFIQIYCKKLIAHLYNRRDVNNPLTPITDEDLEAVERDKDFLSDIRSKFKLNLDLDKRYAAIALILADQYYRDGAKALTAIEVRALCDLVATKLFATTRPGAYESLLEEMEILTILERVGGRYGLRTPNIAMMLGDRESVDQQLDALGTETPIQQRSRGEARTPLISPKKHSRDSRIFPLPSAWVRSIFSTNSSDRQADRATADQDLLILVGNEISGISEISKLSGEWQIANAATLDVGVYHSSQAARTMLVRNARFAAARAMRSRWLHCVATGSWNVADLPEYSRLASTLSASSASRADTGVTAVTRLALLANMSRGYELAKLSHSGTGQDCTGWRVVAIPPWTDDALYFRLQTMEKPDILNSDEARKALLLASCGFGSEIEELCNSVRTVEDALRAPIEAEKRLGPSLEFFYRRVGMPAAVDTQDLKNAEQLLLMLDGEKRDGSIDEIRETYRVSLGLFVFLQWMGLLQEAPGGAWHVPALYKRLLK